MNLMNPANNFNSNQYNYIGRGGVKLLTLQGLRAYGVLAIFISHCGYFRLGLLGGLGVSYFILISGYLAAVKYYDPGITSHKQLIIKRLKKYYPLHIAALIFSLILDFRASWTARKAITLLLNVSLLQSYLPVSNIYFSFNAVSWYLSLTMFFALITPAVLCLLKKIERRKFVFQTALIFFLFQFIWCAFSMIMPGKFHHWLVYISPFIRSIDFLIGGLIFLFIRTSGFKAQDRMKVNLLFVSVVIYEIIFSLISRNVKANFFWELFSVSMWTLPNVILICCILFNEKRESLINKIFTNKFAVYIGNISFEFFMLHTLALQVSGIIFRKLFNESYTFAIYAAALGITIIAAHICHEFARRFLLFHHR